MSFNTDGKSFFEQEREEIARLEKRGGRKFLKLYDFGASSLRAEIKRRPAQYFFLFISTFLGSVITSSIALFGFSANILAQFAAPSLQAKAEPAAVVSITPKIAETEKYDHLLLASKLRANEADFVIIDIRSKKEFATGHIVTAKNIPVYESEMVTDEGNIDSELLLEAFDGVKGEKLIIIYGHNSYSTLPGEIAELLNENDFQAKPLAVGWEEWEHLNGR